MTDTKDYTIELSSDDPRWWCYNAVVMCGCYNSATERRGIVSAKREIAPAGSELKACPKGVNPQERLVLTAPDCHHIDLYVYVIPHTLPADNDVRTIKELTFDVRVTRAGKLLLSKHFATNPWSGTSSELKGISEEKNQ